jgi:hypothetical protein
MFLFLKLKNKEINEGKKSKGSDYGLIDGKRIVDLAKQINI